MLESFYKDETLTVAFAPRLIVAVWRDAPTFPQMLRLRAASEEQRRRAADGAALLNLVLSGTPSFSNDVRKEATSQTQATSGWGIANAHVVLVDGFRGVAVRSFFGTMMLLARTDVPTKVFGELETAVRWVAPLMERVDPAIGVEAIRTTCWTAMRED